MGGLCRTRGGNKKYIKMLLESLKEKKFVRRDRRSLVVNNVKTYRN
jgi:hypothetical protein